MAAPPGQIFKQGTLAGLQEDGFSRAPDFARRRIHLQIRELKLSHLVAVIPRTKRLHPREQFLQRKRLYQVVIRPSSKPRTLSRTVSLAVNNSTWVCLPRWRSLSFPERGHGRPERLGVGNGRHQSTVFCEKTDARAVEAKQA